MARTPKTPAQLLHAKIKTLNEALDDRDGEYEALLRKHEELQRDYRIAVNNCREATAQVTKMHSLHVELASDNDKLNSLLEARAGTISAQSQIIQSLRETIDALRAQNTELVNANNAYLSAKRQARSLASKRLSALRHAVEVITALNDEVIEDVKFPG